MQYDTSEPRQARKGATVARRIMCRRVPSLSLIVGNMDLFKCGEAESRAAQSMPLILS